MRSWQRWVLDGVGGDGPIVWLWWVLRPCAPRAWGVSGEGTGSVTAVAAGCRGGGSAGPLHHQPLSCPHLQFLPIAPIKAPRVPFGQRRDLDASRCPTA